MAVGVLVRCEAGNLLGWFDSRLMAGLKCFFLLKKKKSFNSDKISLSQLDFFFFFTATFI